jgi:hypothetical protein
LRNRITALKVKYPYQLNFAIAFVSIVLGCMYILITAPIFIEQLKCASCRYITMQLFRHYWYRWFLYAVLIFAGYRLFNRLIGARRLYYIFFTGATITAVHDVIKEYSEMNSADMALNVVIPIVISLIGTVYFAGYYKGTLKYR